MKTYKIKLPTKKSLLDQLKEAMGKSEDLHDLLNNIDEYRSPFFKKLGRKLCNLWPTVGNMNIDCFKKQLEE